MPRCVHLAGAKARVCFIRVDEVRRCWLSFWGLPPPPPLSPSVPLRMPVLQGVLPFRKSANTRPAPAPALLPPARMQGAQCTSGVMPFLKDSGVASPNDLAVANMGLHHGQVRTGAVSYVKAVTIGRGRAGVATTARQGLTVRVANPPAALSGWLPRWAALNAATSQSNAARCPIPTSWQELDKLSSDFAAYVSQHRAALPRMLWQQTSAQHFKTENGEWPGGEPPYECAPLEDDAFEVQVRVQGAE